MKRSLFVAACLAGLLSVTIGSAGADPSGTVPIAGSNPELSFTGTLTVTEFAAAKKHLTLEGTLNGPLTGLGGQAATLSDLPVQLPLQDATPSCQPPQVTIVTATTPVSIPGFDPITLEALSLVRPVDPADTALVEQLCQIAADDDPDGKLKGKRLVEAVDALNTLGGPWQLAPAPAPTTG